MVEIALDEEARRILAFVCRTLPPDGPPSQVQYRPASGGARRLSLSEYDEACRQLVRERLIVTDPPNAPDCDWIAPTPKGRRAIV
jgi:hypothetical protein